MCIHGEPVEAALKYCPNLVLRPHHHNPTSILFVLMIILMREAECTSVALLVAVGRVADEGVVGDEAVVLQRAYTPRKDEVCFINGFEALVDSMSHNAGQIHAGCLVEPIQRSHRLINGRLGPTKILEALFAPDLEDVRLLGSRTAGRIDPLASNGLLLEDVGRRQTGNLVLRQARLRQLHSRSAIRPDQRLPGFGRLVESILGL